jgi:hypothetical protein
LLRLLIDRDIYNAEVSGGSLAWLATCNEVEGISGVYYSQKTQVEMSEASHDEEKQEDLWKWTHDNIALD